MPEQKETAQPAEIKLDAAQVTASYSNLCRVTGTPEEVILDFALNPYAYGQPSSEPIKLDHRIVLSYAAAKRTALILAETVRRYEERFGVIELDIRKRLHTAPEQQK